MTRGCGDCGASDPSWASINRGILLCVECCSVHRSMGRHISHVKSLHQGTWPPTLLTMINVLTVQNVNSIWEHSLLDPVASKHLRKKPQPKDPLLSVKTEFIQAKHQRLIYVFRPRKDDLPCSPVELSKQLHSSVRSANLDTSLRLLVQGADPNYFNREKGTSCLHVACRTGNSSQAELLVAWGADPNVKDLSGNTPSALAKLNGHIELADRMLELVYEVTDRLAYHLCNRKPNHKNGEHYITLDKMDIQELTEMAKTARGKLQLLPNHLFEELVMDIYDEIDRRECEAVLMSSSLGLERFGVAFLPVNPALSAPRNQGRQKLARLSTSEMAALLRDILMDASRRQHIATLKPNSLVSSFYKRNSKHNYLNKQIPHITDDEPLYDSVASDEDYAALLPVMHNDNSSLKADSILSKYNSTVSTDPFVVSPHNNSKDRRNETLDAATSNVIEILREQLDIRNYTIMELQSKVESLQSALDSITAENIKLKTTVDNRKSFIASNSPPTRDVAVSQNPFKENDVAEKAKAFEHPKIDMFESHSLNRLNQRPISMYETRERSKLNLQFNKNQCSSNNENSISENPSSIKANFKFSLEMPDAKNVHTYLEAVTKGIQELWTVMKDPTGQGYTFRLKGTIIKGAVNDLITLFPKNCDEEITEALDQITSSCATLETVCNAWNGENKDSEGNSMCNIRSAAIELVKAAKVLLSSFPLDSDNV